MPYSGGQFLLRPNSLDWSKRYHDDDFAYVAQATLSSEQAEETNSSYWEFTRVRKANYAIEKMYRLNAPERKKKHWEAVARYFRAHNYADLVFHFGDVPYFNRTMDASDEAEMYKPRAPRTEVDDSIMADLKFAMDNLREDDGYGQVNKYVAAAMACRFMLREGTFLKYHKINDAKAEACLKFAKEAAEVVMSSGKYSISNDFNKLFTSEDLSKNAEVIMARAYAAGVKTHATLSWCYFYPGDKTGVSKALAEAFLKKDGTPIATNYDNDDSKILKTAEAFFADRDPRLALTIRTQYCVVGSESKCAPFDTKCSGYSYNKFMDERLFAGIANKTLDDPKYTSNTNITDAPCVRYAEVLLNYCEIMYELNQLNPSYVFDQTVVDNTINAIRDRKGIEMPHLTITAIGDDFDPKRAAIEAADVAAHPTNSYTTSALLWEIRRERRCELAFEGTRMDDLRRWNKLGYMDANVNPDISLGAWVDKTTYEGITVAGGGESGYIVSGTAREAPADRDYLWSIPSTQITMYKNHGYELKQNPGYN